MICGKCGNNIDKGSVCRFCGNSGEDSGNKIPVYGISEVRGMKWYKFLIYFSLYFSVVTCIIDAYVYFSGNYWNLYEMVFPDVSDIYIEYKAVKYIDIVMGVISVVMAGYIICVRNALADFKKRGPVMLYFMYGINSLTEILYSVAIDMTGALKFDYTMIIGNVAVTWIIIWINAEYFKKRNDMFIG